MTFVRSLHESVGSWRYRYTSEACLPDGNSSDWARLVFSEPAFRVELRQVDRRALRDEHSERAEDRGGLILGGRGDRACSEWEAVEDLVDHPYARFARAHLQEDSYAIVMRLAHRLGEVHSLDRLGQQRVRRPGLIHLVRLTPSSAVDAYALWRAGVQHV